MAKDLTVQPGEQIMLIPLALIEADQRWNSRSVGFEKDGGNDDDDRGFKGVVDSILAQGQDTPVIVRQPLKAGGPYRLVSGFRRYAAISALAKSRDPKVPPSGPHDEGMVKCVIRILTDTEARSLNIRENTVRDDLKKADLAWAVLALCKTGLDNATIIGAQIGKSQGYVSKLKAIASAMTPKVLDMWRSANAEITINQADTISQMAKDLQEAALTRVLAGTPEGGESGLPTRGPNAWQATAEKRAKSLGGTYGTLMGYGLVAAGSEADGFDCLFKIPGQMKSQNKRDTNRLFKVWRAAFVAGVNAALEKTGKPADDSDDDSDE